MRSSIPTVLPTRTIVVDMKRLFVAVGLSLLLSSHAAAQGTQASPNLLRPTIKGPQVEQPQRVLFVGNSYFYYNNSLHNHVKRIVEAADKSLDKKLDYKSATIGGAELSHHNIDHLTKPGQIGVKEPFQLVILSGHSADGLSETRGKRFREAVQEFNKVIASRGGKVALVMPQAYVKPHTQARPENIRGTESLYVSVGNEVGALVIPVGLAFEEAYRRRPDLALHVEYDGSHPNVAGSYLSAATVYAAVYGKSPVGNSYDYYGRIDKATATFLQEVAEYTVKQFYAR